MKSHILVFTVISLFSASCSKFGDPVDYRREMRDFVIAISSYARTVDEGFLVIPQNGIELVTSNGNEDGTPEKDYLEAVNGHGQEELLYGYREDDKPSPEKETAYLRSFLDISKEAGNLILITDYCSTHAYMDDSYTRNHQHGYIAFAADHRELDNIPGYPSPIYQENPDLVTSLSEVKNFLYLINPEGFITKSALIRSVVDTNYDLLIMDLFSRDNTAFTAEEIDQLRQKANGGRRLVICYLSIGEAEDYRYYWHDSWRKGNPEWLERENPDWEGNYKVRYWDPEWQQVIFGNDEAYLDRILQAGFDGVYLDIIDAYEYFE